MTEGGEYHWVAVADLHLLEVKPLARPRDLIWRPATIEVRDGPRGDAFLPAIYATPAPSGEEALLLGRGTDWLESENAPVRGIGLKLFLVGDADIPVHELGRLDFNAPAAADTPSPAAETPSPAAEA